MTSGLQHFLFHQSLQGRVCGQGENHEPPKRNENPVPEILREKIDIFHSCEELIFVGYTFSVYEPLTEIRKPLGQGFYSGLGLSALGQFIHYSFDLLESFVNAENAVVSS